MKILQINSVHYRRGGADVVYLNTGKLLEDNGHEVYYFSQKNENNYPVNTSNYFIKPINYFNDSILKRITLLPRFFYSFESAKKIDSIIKNYNPEIAHIHLYKAYLTSSILRVLKHNHIPIVITLHDYGFICPNNLLLDGKMNICERCINGSSLNCILHKCNRNNLLLSSLSSFEYIYQKIFFPFDKYFNAIITVSKFSRAKHIESNKYKWKVKHLYNFSPKLKNTKYNKVKGKYMLYFGRLSEEKGIKTLIDAWQVNKNHGLLKIVGTGDLFDELKQNKSDSIEFLGFKSGVELNDLIKKASFIIVPSVVYENNPLTIIEAYSFGKPVIGSNVGGIAEIVLDNKTGFLFKMRSIHDLSGKILFANSMTQKGYGQLSENARRFAEENFDEDTHYKSLMFIFRETILNYNKKVRV